MFTMLAPDNGFIIYAIIPDPISDIHHFPRKPCAVIT